jgi:hypothetical protein
MPLKLNVGLSRKVGESNYGSRGASVNVEMELESTLVGEPAKLQDRIRQLFAIVRSSLAEELNGNGNGGHTKPVNGSNGHTEASAGGESTSRQNGTPRAATQSQVRALHAITKSKGVSLTRLLRGRYQVDLPDDLTIKQASELIDSLKNVNGGAA